MSPSPLSRPEHAQVSDDPADARARTRSPSQCFRHGMVQSLPFQLVIVPFGMLFGVVAMEAKASGRPEQAVREQYVRGVSMRTWVTVDDLADTVLFLASPAAGGVNGQVLRVCGQNLVGA